MLILWSGGLDSTLALYRALSGSPGGWAWNTAVHASDKAGEVRYAHRTLSINSEHVCGQRWLPDARKAIGSALRAAGMQFAEMVVDAHTGQMRRVAGYPIQGAVWLSIASLHAYEDEDVAISWLRGELDNLAEARALFEKSQQYLGKTGKLRTPLENHTKADVLVELDRAKVPGLVGAAWWCESPHAGGAAATARYARGLPCRECVKCEEVAAARWRISAQQRYHDITVATA